MCWLQVTSLSLGRAAKQKDKIFVASGNTVGVEATLQTAVSGSLHMHLC